MRIETQAKQGRKDTLFGPVALGMTPGLPRNPVCPEVFSLNFTQWKPSLSQGQAVCPFVPGTHWLPRRQQKLMCEMFMCHFRRLEKGQKVLVILLKKSAQRTEPL